MSIRTRVTKFQTHGASLKGIIYGGISWILLMKILLSAIQPSNVKIKVGF